MLVLLVLQSTQWRAWDETFREGRLDPSRWQVTEQGDFRERSVDVVERGTEGFQLRVRMDTRGTRDDSVKFLGVRAVDPIPLGEGLRIEVDLDWNEQFNGSYLSAGLVLAPSLLDGNPLSAGDWLSVAYVGVPPGRDARMLVSSRTDGRERTLHDDGWPERTRAGRRIKSPRVALVARNGGFQVWENETLVCETQPILAGFEHAYLYLQMSSHSNYPPREILYRRIRVEPPR